jgi:hypothetical protein
MPQLKAEDPIGASDWVEILNEVRSLCTVQRTQPQLEKSDFESARELDTLSRAMSEKGEQEHTQREADAQRRQDAARGGVRRAQSGGGAGAGAGAGAGGDGRTRSCLMSKQEREFEQAKEIDRLRLQQERGRQDGHGEGADGHDELRQWLISVGLEEVQAANWTAVLVEEKLELIDLIRVDSTVGGGDLAVLGFDTAQCRMVGTAMRKVGSKCSH